MEEMGVLEPRGPARPRPDADAAGGRSARRTDCVCVPLCPCGAGDARGRVPIVGTVAAGAPILAQECIEDYLTFDTNGREGEYFALRVRG